MKTKAWIDKIKMNDGKEIEFKENSINVFVGANNVGKSVLLKEIFQKSESFAHPTQIISSLSIDSQGTQEDLLEDISSNSIKRFNHEDHYQGFGFDIYKSYSYQWDDLNYNGFSSLGGFFIKALNTESRIQSSASPDNIDRRHPASHPIHVLARNDHLFKSFETYFKETFNTDIILNYGGGAVLPLHIGTKVDLQPGESLFDNSYLDRLDLLPRIEEQGDGVRSFAGVLLNILCSPQRIFFIDEPEAFLHPPQARKLGEIIGKNEKEKQLFIATHSIDFILGLLSTGKEVSIIRLERENDSNPTKDLNEEEITKIWSDPLLRHSNILNGLFYKQVIICESESDSMFYETILGEEDIGHNVFFTNANGKGQIKKIVNAFNLTGVQTNVIVDIDILLDDGTFKNIYESLNGDWIEIKDDYLKIKTFLDARIRLPRREDIKNLLSPIIDSETESIEQNDIQILRNALVHTKTSKNLKILGFQIFEEEGIKSIFANFNQKLIQNNLYIVPVGELESFDSNIKKHGPAWTIEAVENFSEGKPYEEAKAFILQIVSNKRYHITP